jgi:hypothetical protein
MADSQSGSPPRFLELCVESFAWCGTTYEERR